MEPRFFLLICLCFLVQYSHGKESLLELTTGSSSAVVDPTRVTQISWNPRAFLYRGFLTDEECDHLINLAKGKLEKSMVVDSTTGEGMVSEVRTSSGMFLQRGQDEIVERIEQKIGEWTFLPAENGEQMQILRYENGEQYEAHLDVLVEEAYVKMGGYRVATVLMYLSNVTKGGETVFPNSDVKQAKTGGDWSDCAKQGYSVKPVKGDALLFFDLHPDASIDGSSLHGSCPVIEGEKWSATKWIHVRSYAQAPTSTDCVDLDAECPAWALRGECETNPLYMVGSHTAPGSCRKSCSLCSHSP